MERTTKMKVCTLVYTFTKLYMSKPALTSSEQKSSSQCNSKEKPLDRDVRRDEIDTEIVVRVGRIFRENMEAYGAGIIPQFVVRKTRVGVSQIFRHCTGESRNGIWKN